MVVVGSLSDGFSIYGPFDSHEDAERWVTSINTGPHSWEITDLMVPEGEEDQAESLLVAPFEESYEGEALVTVWRGGEAEMSYRAQPTHSWGPPVKMERRATR